MFKTIQIESSLIEIAQLVARWKIE